MDCARKPLTLQNILGLLIAVCVSLPAAAQQPQMQWIDAQSGQVVPQADLVPWGTTYDPSADPNHASVPGGKANFFRDPAGIWRNAADGQTLPERDIVPWGTQYDPHADPNHASIAGGKKNFVRVPIPRPAAPPAQIIYEGPK